MNTKLRTAIFKEGLTQRDLARKTKIHESFISMAIRGKYNLDVVQKAKIAKILNRPQEQIFTAN